MVASSELVAEEALSLIDVQYEPLPTIASPEEALALFSGDPLAPGGGLARIAQGSSADLCLLDRPFKGDLDVARTIVFAAQLSATPPAYEQWVKVTEGRFWDDLPRWSPDGNTMFFTSDRDGFRCIWARRLDAKTKQTKGEAFPVVHLHKMQLSLANLSLAEFELAAGKGRLVFPMGELRGNIWLMEPASQQ